MSIRALSLALTLTIGATAATTMTPAYATDGRTAAQKCINRDDCHLSPANADGSFTIVFDGGGVIWCPDVNGQCVVVSPDVKKGGKPFPTAGVPIGKTLGTNAPGRNPVNSNPKPTKGPIGVVPTGFHPVRGPLKPIGNTGSNAGAPILLARSGHGRH